MCMGRDRYPSPASSRRNCVLAEQFIFLLCDAAIAGLPTADKGANRTIPDCAACLPRAMCGAAVRRETGAPCRGRQVLAGGRRGLAVRQGERALTVTTITSAE